MYFTKIRLAAGGMGSEEVRENGMAVFHIGYASCLDKTFGSLGGESWPNTKYMPRIQSVGLQIGY